jgi:hypothetical protein
MGELPTNTWFPVATLLLGYLSKSIFDWIEHRRSLRKDNEARRAQLRAQLLERRTAFQRQTLLDLQDWLAKLARATGASFHQDRMAFHETGEWQKQQIEGGWSDRHLEAQTAVNKYSVRVRDERVRVLVKKLTAECSNILMSSGKEVSEGYFQAAIETMVELNGRIGEILRQLDDEEDGWSI